MSEKQTETRVVPEGDDAIKGRLREVCETDWGGNLNRMAKALHMPQPALWKILRGDQPPNAQLLVALAKRTTVNVHWVVTGRGPRRLDGAAGVLRGDAVVRPRVPVAKAVLPGRPQQHRDMLGDESLDPLALTPTQYWLQVRKSDPITRIKDEQVNAGDWLLFEADPARFPPADDLVGKLVVVPGSVRGSKEPRLAAVETVEDDRLTVDTFDLGRIDPSQLEEETVIRELPDGKLHAFRRPVLKAQPGKGGRRGTPRRPVHEHELYYNPLGVRSEDLLAVCVLIVRPR
jgi:hypothetical protein